MTNGMKQAQENPFFKWKYMMVNALPSWAPYFARKSVCLKMLGGSNNYYSKNIECMQTKEKTQSRDGWVCARPYINRLCSVDEIEFSNFLKCLDSLPDR